MLQLSNGSTTEQIDAKRLAQIMGIPDDIFDKLEKNPVFEINPSLCKPDKLNGGVIAPAGKSSKPVFSIKKDGLTWTIRYYTAEIPDKINPRITKYEPVRVKFEDKLAIYPELDLAVFMYCMPSCADSTLAMPNWWYTFQNKEKKAKTVTDRAGKIGEALVLINKDLSDHDILMIAKGLYAQNREMKVIPNPSAKNKTIGEIKADLTTLAMSNPDLFLTAADSDINEFYGMVLDAVDKGIFKVRVSPNQVKSWYWEVGPLKDSPLTDISPAQNDFDALKSYIEADPNRVFGTLTKAHQQLSGQQNMENFFKDIKREKNEYLKKGILNDMQEEINRVNPPVVNTGGHTEAPPIKLPASWNDAISVFTEFNDNKRPEPKVLGKFWEGVKDNSITAENIREKLSELLEKA